MNFQTWFETFIKEKGINTAQVFEVTSKAGTYNYIPFEAMVEFVNALDSKTQATIKHNFVMIDFKNGDVMHFINYIVQGMADSRE